MSSDSAKAKKKKDEKGKKKDKKKEEDKDDKEKIDEKPVRNYATYYDAPDGCHVEKKIMVCARYGVVTGLIAGTYDIMMYSHAVGIGPMLARYARHIVPISLMGATFAAVANAVQHAREIDDPLNYFLGGLACGPLVALYTRSPHGLVAGGLALGLVGVVKKEAVDRDFAFVQNFPPHMNTIDDWRRDYTFMADPRDEMRHTCDDDFDDDDGGAAAASKKKKKKKKKKCK